MPILELFPKPAPGSDPASEPASGPSGEQAGRSVAPTPSSTTRGLKPLPQQQLTTMRIKVRTARFGELEEHEIIHLLDALNDERARAQFRESIYISTIFCLAVAWFLFYGPHVIFHQPYYKDPIAAMKEHDQQLTLISPSTPKLKQPPPKPVIDKKTMAQLQKEAREAPPVPQPPTPQPQEEAHNAAPPPPPPVAQPPLPAAPQPPASVPQAPLPAAPQPKIASNSQSAHDSMQNTMRGSLNRGGMALGSPGRAGPLQAGATILSDTQGVDFSAYMRTLHDHIQRNWNPLIPEEVEPPLLKKGIVGIRFMILPDGSIASIKLETTSGDVALDKAAWYAITSEGQFPPLPRQFHGPDLELRVGFFYNTPLD